MPRAKQAGAALLFFAINLYATQLGRAGGAQPDDDGGALVHPRYAHTATLLADGRVLLAGGLIAPNGNVSATCEIYDPATNTWTATGSLHQARWNHGSVLLPDGRVLAMGGGFNGTAEIYDPATASWTMTASMITAREYFDPVLLNSGKVLAAGGGPGLKVCELFDPATGTWTPTGSLRQRRDNYHASLLADGKVLVAGGHSERVGYIPESELYDPATGTWSNSGSLNFPRIFNVQVKLADGRVLVAGGVVSPSYSLKVTRSAEIYDPNTGLWTLTHPLTTPHANFSANLLNDGKVFAAGGIDQFTPTEEVVSTIEQFDPSTSQWRLLANTLASPRNQHTATTLLDGSLILAGGLGKNNAFLPDAELFVRPR